LTDSQSKPQYFLNPKQHTDGIIQELLHMRFVKDRKAIEDIRIEPVVDTYPIYHRHYNKDFGQAAASVKAFSKRIHLLGRSGAFWYNNSDHSIRFAMELADKILGRQKKEFNYRDYFGGLYSGDTHR
jgi:protoporphyrinogen oxidase